MKNYWSCSKFADWLRGTPKLDSASSKDWNTWRIYAKAAHPFRYWLVEDALDRVQDFLRWPMERVNDVRYYLNNRFEAKTHSLTSRLPRGKWHEFEERLLHCTFDSFVDFIEIETAWSHCMWGEKDLKDFNVPWWRRQWWTRWFLTWRCPEAAIAHLEWEMTLKYDEWIPEDHPDYNKPTGQAVAAKEKWALYYWWKHVRPQRADPYEYCGWTAYCDEREAAAGERDWIFDDDSVRDRERSRVILDAMQKLEEQYDTEDEEMLIRLVKLRKSLWT